MKGCRGSSEMMAGSMQPVPLLPPPAALSGQELEAWLEDLESVLYPSRPAASPSADCSKLSQLWLEDLESLLHPSRPAASPSADCPRPDQLWLDIESVLSPSAPRPPSQEAQRVSHLLLGDLETILSPPSGESRGQTLQPPPLTQLEFEPPGLRESTRDCGPPEEEGVEASDRLRTVQIGQGLPSADPGEGGPSEGRPGERIPSPEASPPGDSPPGRRGVKRRRAEGCSCGQGGGEQVEKLTAENGALRRRIRELTAEVELARKRLIDKVVGAC